MTIVEALKNDILYLYIGNGNKRLFFDNGKWKVIEHKYRAKGHIVLVETEDEEEAVKIFLED